MLFCAGNRKEVLPQVAKSVPKSVRSLFFFFFGLAVSIIVVTCVCTQVGMSGRWLR